jgi:hypothetical protein
MLRYLVNILVKSYTGRRKVRLEELCKISSVTQRKVLHEIISKAQNTEYGRQFKFNRIRDDQDWKVVGPPIVQYETIFPYVQRMMYGESNVLWPGKVKWFSKSSGTTNDKSKFIPITDELMNLNLIASSWDTTGIMYSLMPDLKLFSQKNLMMGGSLKKFDGNPDTFIGDVSAIMIHRMPAIGKPFYTPDMHTALMEDWEEKIQCMANICTRENVVSFGGVPTWTIVLFKRILEQSGKKNMLEVWPNVKYYLHGGVGFEPYREQFQEFLPTKDFQYLEVYNASEGFFAIQDLKESEGMLLLVNNGIYYEFIPLENFSDSSPPIFNLQEVDMDKNYAIIITTMGGLYRYVIGDVVRFTSLNPFRLMITGRTKQYINVFGEELMVSNTDKALSVCCHNHKAVVTEYTVAPVFLTHSNKGGHEWLIEFEKEPENINEFIIDLDNTLRKLNSDYDAKRQKNLALQQLILHTVPQGSFHKWLQQKGKLGGQHKVPRLSNDRKFLDEILNLTFN